MAYICSSNIYFQILFIIYLTEQIGFSNSYTHDFGINDNNYNKPHINASSEVNIDSNSDYVVDCKHNSPITWIVPDVSDETYGSFLVTDGKSQPDDGFKFTKRLTIINASYEFTGFYKCHSLNNPDEYESIYIFVRDDEQLIVSGEFTDTVLVTQNEFAVIPCRPTSPDVTVTLNEAIGEVPIDVFDKDTQTIYHYDPRFGFITNNTSELGPRLFICIFSRDDSTTQKASYLLDVEVATDFLPTPIIRDKSDGHTIVGEQLELECRIRTSSQIDFHWTTPDNDRVKISGQIRDPQDPSFAIQQLIIESSQLTDSGMYYCNVSDNQDHTSVMKHNVKIHDKDEHNITLWEENGRYNNSASAGDDDQIWTLHYYGHPIPKFYWINNKNETIPPETNTSDKYETILTKSTATLIIKHIDIHDFGNYTLVAENDYEIKKIILSLTVRSPPLVEIQTKAFHTINQPGRVKCVAAAYPKPKISWAFKACQDDQCIYEPVKERASRNEGLDVISIVEIPATKSGFVKCTAINSIGGNEAIQGFYVSDIEDGLGIFGLDETVYVDSTHRRATVAKGEPIQMTCGASIYNYTKLDWYHNDRRIDQDERYTIERGNTDFTYRTTFKVAYMDQLDGGIYSCKLSTNSNEIVYENMTVTVSNPSPPWINETNMNKEIKIKLYERLYLYCEVSGLPKPTITWYRNNEIFQSHELMHDLKNGILSINRTKLSDEGTYKCMVSNKLGEVSKETSVTFSDRPMDYTWLIAVIVVLILFLLFCGFCIFRVVRKERKLERELKIAGLDNFEKGAIESLNPELGLDDQVELLPYNKKWEFPIEKLKLGKQLGCGAFGVVVKGEAKGISEDEECTTVAVKMVKKNAEYTYIRALASELKIMVHLGKHINVVNLLGACTRNVAKRELLVIVEYCRFGNLHNYLFKHRQNYIDQVDPKNGNIDYYIGQDILQRTYSVSSGHNNSNPQSPSLKYAALSFSNNSSGVPTQMADYRGKNYTGATTKTESTVVSMNPNSGDDEMILSNNSSVSVQPEWRSNYGGDYKGQVHPICTKDILAWAFQVARGMEYLVSRQVLHGDLAARNILLADNNVIKICDFGLAKSMYKSDNYKKKKGVPLPIKWMAIESIRDQIFSTQSDVWSFGIVLWEFFSLARTPYPGMEADERLCNKLFDGYRMESPEYAPKEVYKMMMDCWKSNPTARPSFASLSERIGSLLEDSVRKHYIDLNDPYLVMNTQRLMDGESDYLSMLSPPNFETISSPNYINDDLSPPNVELTPGYLTMNNPQNIFSPTRIDNDPDEVFTFDNDDDANNSSQKKTRSDNKKSAPGSKTEMLPMLSTLHVNESDCESSPTSSMIQSFSNPSYHLPPTVQTRDDDNKPKDKDDTVEFPPDNYINMLQNKKKIINNGKNNNPFANKIDDDSKRSHYINGNVMIGLESVDV